MRLRDSVRKALRERREVKKMATIEVPETCLMQAAIDQLTSDLNAMVESFRLAKSVEDRLRYRTQARTLHIAIHAIEQSGWGVDLPDADRKWIGRFQKTVGKGMAREAMAVGREVEQ